MGILARILAFLGGLWIGLVALAPVAGIINLVETHRAHVHFGEKSSTFDLVIQVVPLAFVASLIGFAALLCLGWASRSAKPAQDAQLASAEE